MSVLPRSTIVSAPELVVDLDPKPLARQIEVSRRLLEEARGGSRAETLRLYVAQPGVAFGPRDAASPRYASARRAAEAAGVDAAVRLAGGRPVVFHEGVLGFSWALPDLEGRRHIQERFQRISSLCRDVLRGFGVDAHVGPVAGEYCPGECSVNAGGAVKLAGFGQRVVSSAVHVGGLIVVTDGERVRRWLDPVHAALGISWDPSTVGSVAGALDAPVDLSELATALGHAFTQQPTTVESPRTQSRRAEPTP